MEFDQMPRSFSGRFHWLCRDGILPRHVAKPCGVVSVYLIGCGLLWGRICHKKDEPNHHPHPNTTGLINIGHCANTPFILMFLPLLMPLLAYAFTGIGETLTRSIFGSGAVIAFGKRCFYS